MRHPNVIVMTNDWIKGLRENRAGVKFQDTTIWVPARPEGFASPWHRIKATWLVFTGRADALLWFGQ